jgi:hypothetical protein
MWKRRNEQCSIPRSVDWNSWSINIFLLPVILLIDLYTILLSWFNDSFSAACVIAYSVERGQKNNELGRMRVMSWPVLRYYRSICVEELQKWKKISARVIAFQAVNQTRDVHSQSIELVILVLRFSRLEFSVQPRLSWERDFRRLWNPKVHYRVYKSLILDPILILCSPVHATAPYFSEYPVCHYIPLYVLVSQMVSYLQVFCLKILYVTLFNLVPLITLIDPHYTGLLKKKNTLTKIYFTKTADAKSMSCVRMERKSLIVLISMIWSGASVRLWLLLPVTCCDECGKSWIIDLTSAVSHVGLTSSACKV